MTDTDYAEDLACLANAPSQAEFQLHILEQAARGHCMNINKTEYMCFKQDEAIATLNPKPKKLIDQFKYLGSNISSTESNVNICIGRSFARAHINDFKYSKWLNNSICPTDGTLTGTTRVDLGVMVKKGLLYILQSPRTQVSPLDAV